jgi:hypothetical protein
MHEGIARPANLDQGHDLGKASAQCLQAARWSDLPSAPSPVVLCLNANRIKRCGYLNSRFPHPQKYKLHVTDAVW